MTEAKPTPGPWRVSRTNAGLFVSGAQPGYLCEVYAGNKTSMAHMPEQDANAALIAEAGTVYHETGLTPRQLAEQRAELIEALEPFALIAEYDIGADESDGDDYLPMQRHNVAPRVTVGHLRQALAALAKAKGGEA